MKRRHTDKPQQPSWFKFDIIGWKLSLNVQAMNWEERGIYLELIMDCWREGSVAYPPLRELRMTANEWERVWPALEPCFAQSNGRLYQRRVDRDRPAAMNYLQTQQRHGLRGGRPQRVAEGSDKGSQRLPEGSLKGIQRLSKGNSHEKEIEKEKESTKERESRERDQRSGKDKDSAFAEFWSAYPKKVGKDAAWKAWQKHQPDGLLAAVILRALEWQSKQDNWLKDNQQYVPNPATWLNQGRWQDEPPTASAVYSDTTRYNLAASDEAERLINAVDAQRTAKHGQRR